jgi:two-component sensor histidine kinase
MLRLHGSIQKDQSLRSFIGAGAIMAVAIAARAAIDPALPGTPPFITLYPAVIIAGLFCGPLAAAASGVAGLIAAIYLWIPPRLAFGPMSPTGTTSIALFTTASIVVLWATSTLRKQLDGAEIARQALELGLGAGGVGTWEINLKTRQITASPAAYALHNISETANHTTLEDWLRHIHPDDLVLARAALQDPVANGSTAAYTYRISNGAGAQKWISARGSVIISGGERRLLCALVDISEQLRVQDELRRERERLRLALQAGALAVWDLDPQSGALQIDTSYAAAMGFNFGSETLTREQVGQRIHPEDLAYVAAEHDALIASGRDYRIEYRIITEDGETRWLVSQGILVKGDMPSDPGRMVGIIQDISAPKQREAELRNLAAARELLIREADHRIKNSLQMVISLLTMQLRSLGDSAAGDALRGAIARVGAIAASHLALQGSEDLRRIDLCVTLQELCAHFADLHPGITIAFHASEPLILDADRAIPLALSVSEILTNALRHAFAGRDSGAVTVEAMTEASVLAVRVTDNGIGLQAKTTGKGLGSRIIRAFTAQISASMQVETTPQTGTAVTLRLPIVPTDPTWRAAS